MHRLLSDRSLRWGEPILASYPFRGFLHTWEKLGDDKVKWSDELDWFTWTNFNWVSKVIQECIAEASVSPLEGGGGYGYTEAMLLLDYARWLLQITHAILAANQIQNWP